MRSQKDEHEKLKGILRQAYWEKEKIEVADLWTEDLMCRIRELGEITPAPRFLEMFEPFVWRLVPVVCVLLFVLIGVFLTLDFTSGNDLFHIFMNGNEELTLVQVFPG